MAKWTKQPKQTNNSLPLVAANKKITSAEFNELTQIINDNFDATVAPIDVVYGKKGEDWVVIPAGGGLTIAEIVTGIEAITIEANKLNYLSLKNQATASNGITRLSNNFELGSAITKDTFLIRDATKGITFMGDVLAIGTTIVNNFILTGFLFGGNQSTPRSYGPFNADLQNKAIFNDRRGITTYNDGSGGSNFPGSKTGIQYYNFAEEDDNGTGADYSTLVGTSLVPRKFVEDITGLLTALNTTNKTSLVAAINEVLASSGGGGLTIAEIVTGLEALAAANRLDYNALKNTPDLSDFVDRSTNQNIQGNKTFNAFLTEIKGTVSVSQGNEFSPFVVSRTDNENLLLMQQVGFGAVLVLRDGGTAENTWPNGETPSGSAGFGKFIIEDKIPYFIDSDSVKTSLLGGGIDPAEFWEVNSLDNAQIIPKNGKLIPLESIDSASSIDVFNGGVLQFNTDKTIFKQQDGDLTLSLAATLNNNAKSIILTINGNNVNSLTIPSKFRNINGGEFDNTKLNIITLTYVSQIGSTELVYYALNTTAALDNVGPVLESYLLENSNSYVDVTFSEGVYGNVGATLPVEVADFDLVFTANGGEATNAVITSVTKVDTNALVGGETVIRVNITITGVATGTETINIQVESGTSIFDSFGNPANASEATGVITLRGQFSSEYIAVLNKSNERGNTKPLIADQQKENTFIESLVDDGIFAKTTLLYNLKTGGNAGYSQINVADPDNFNLVEIGTPVFNNKQGWRNNGNNNALNTQYIKGTSLAGNISVHFKTTQANFATSGNVFGARVTSNNRIYALPWSAGNELSASLGGGANTLQTNVSSANNFISITNDGTNYRMYKDGVLISTKAGNTISNVTLAMYLMALNNGGLVDGEMDATVDIEFFALTEFLTGAEVTNLYNAWNTYNTAL